MTGIDIAITLAELEAINGLQAMLEATWADQTHSADHLRGAIANLDDGYNNGFGEPLMRTENIGLGLFEIRIYEDDGSFIGWTCERDHPAYGFFIRERRESR